MSSATEVPYAPDYASYNWTGAPADYSLTTNADLGGDSRMFQPSRESKDNLADYFLDRTRKLE